MAIIHSIQATNYDTSGVEIRQVTLAEHVEFLKSQGATVELFDAPQKVSSCSSSFEAVGLVMTYVGCVLSTREKNYHDDSDFYALVWDEAAQRIRSIEYDTTRFAGGGIPGTANTDAVAIANNGFGRPYRFPIPRYIDGLRQFNVTAQFAYAITPTRNCNIECCLEGFLYRSVV